MNHDDYILNLELLENISGSLKLRVELLNQTSQTLNDFTLMFDLSREVIADSVKNGRLVSQVGSHCEFAPPVDLELMPGESWLFELTSPTEKIANMSEMPIGIYVCHQGSFMPVQLRQHNLPQTKAVDLGELSLPEARSGIIPQPAEVEVMPGCFSVPNQLTFGHLNSELQSSVHQSLLWFNDQLEDITECVPAMYEQVPHIEFIFMTDQFVDESYSLLIAEDKIVISAKDTAGYFYALVSLAQLLQQHQTKLPCQRIHDYPRFEYRGQMLDCARHFHEVTTIKALLEQMAWLKLNRFHWHLTDDEGWRLEIDAYPELTQIGAWRGESDVLAPQFGSGPQRYGGFYSKEQVREIIEFAAQRQIMVIPEIDIPGHARALVHSLPDLLQEPQDTSEFISIQQYRDNVVNPGLAGSYRILETILDEVCELFPAPFIHLGADEVPEGVWEKSPAAISMAKQKGLVSVRELQGVFLRHLQEYLASKGKLMIGWEEAVQGGLLAKDATLCAWRDVDAVVEAANQGYSVIMCTAQYTYLDLAWNKDIHEPGVLWAGSLDLKTCYHFEPMSTNLTPTGREAVSGIQAQMWTEYVESKQQMEYLLYPRLFAVAETAWSPAARKNWDGFLSRLGPQLERLEAMLVNFRPMISSVADKELLCVDG